MFASLLIRMAVLAATTSPANSMRIALPEPVSPIMDKIAEIATRQIASRSNVKVVRAGEAAFAIAIGVDPALPPEGFEIADAAGGGVRITGADEHATL